LGAVNLGRLNIPEQHKIMGASWGIREVQSLVEIRVPFELKMMELDSIARGARDADLDELVRAAGKVAAFEESAVYNGFKQGQIEGILSSSPHKPVILPGTCDDYPQAVAAGIKLLSETGIEGPYALVLGTDSYHQLIGAVKGYPTFRAVERLAEGGILHSQALEGGVLLSVRGGDFELTLGQDISIGFNSHDGNKVELYFAETFTFRVLEQAAAVELKKKQ
jgi:uncharacterized linocin/CFP29 family protein